MQIEVPRAPSTFATAINPGVYYGSSGSGHGFLLSNGAFTTIDVPGATFTLAFGIDLLGDILGLLTSAAAKLMVFCCAMVD